MKYDCLIVDDEIPLSESTSEYFNMFDIKTNWVTDTAACLRFLNEQLETINTKADQINLQIRNMFHATLEELYFMDKMGGSLEFFNHQEGFTARIILKLA
ncbi:MAG: transcriptional regulator [Anaerocolumna sp.]|jgi:hypothetical protein|nr:transcriptional regulator [Anaerocolumna sp.]